MAQLKWQEITMNKKRMNGYCIMEGGIRVGGLCEVYYTYNDWV